MNKKSKKNQNGSTLKKRGPKPGFKRVPKEAQPVIEKMNQDFKTIKDALPWKLNNLKGIPQTPDDVLRVAAAKLIDVANQLESDQYNIINTWNRRKISPMDLAHDVAKVSSVETKIRQLAVNIIGQHVTHTESQHDHASMQTINRDETEQ